jgi:TatD DNase family protein
MLGDYNFLVYKIYRQMCQMYAGIWDVGIEFFAGLIYDKRDNRRKNKKTFFLTIMVMCIMTSFPEPVLIDGHAHLNRIDDMAGVLQRAQEAGVKHVIGVGMDLESNKKTLALAQRFSSMVVPAIGYHPWEIREDDIAQTLAFIEKHLGDCIALGEVGLDYKTKVKKPLQQRVFLELLDLSEKMSKPVIVHCRFSHERCHRMVSEAGLERAVFHWYSGPLNILDRIIADGYFVSATPALAYSKPHQAAMKQAPLNRILIETDTPVAYQGKVSEPAHLLTTLRELSRLRDIPLFELAEVTAENSKSFYGPFEPVKCCG